jgi:alanine racemase
MLTTSKLPATSVRRDAWVEIDLSAIEYNIAQIKSWTAKEETSQKPCRLMAVVKADAYGHGAQDLVPVMEGSQVDYFGVASVDEGYQLRQMKTKRPILILSPTPSWAISSALDADLQFTVTSLSQIKDIAKQAAKQAKKALVHLKVDTGMHRLGLNISELGEALEAIASNPALSLSGFYSHLANPENQSSVDAQNSLFQKCLKQLNQLGIAPGLVHLASGQAARNFSATHYDMVRVGLYLYGLEPNSKSTVVKLALALRARINQLKIIDKQESLGYGLTWTAARPSKIASIPIGYADGIDRRLSNSMEALMHGIKIKQVGLISMDQMLFDVTDVPQAQEGDVITLIGQEKGANGVNSSQSANQTNQTLYLADWAKMLDTVTYELVCRMRLRLPRIYTRSKSIGQ